MLHGKRLHHSLFIWWLKTFSAFIINVILNVFFYDFIQNKKKVQFIQAESVFFLLQAQIFKKKFWNHLGFSPYLW